MNTTLDCRVRKLGWIQGKLDVVCGLLIALLSIAG
jgi:hypothetical protein